MKGPAIDQVVYAHMFPKPKTTDPQNFQGLLQRQLVPEVRHETQAFYGHLSSQEAKYPGLDYSYQPHRNRLSRYPWHRRLFRAFEALKLTESEIAGLTKWEGTRWAKERFEREQGVVIRDTTGDGIEDWVELRMRLPVVRMERQSEDREMDDNGEAAGEAEDEDMVEEEEEEEDSDGEMRSVGIELNERLRAAVAEREAGNAATVMDEEWEQWLKDAVEAGGLPFPPSDLSPNADIPGTRPASNNTQAMHPRLLNAARLGQWQQIPDFLQNMVRQNIEANNRRIEENNSSASSSSSSRPSNLSARLSGSPRRARTVSSNAPGSSILSARLHGAESVARDFTGRSVQLPPLMPSPASRVVSSRAPLADTAP